MNKRAKELLSSYFLSFLMIIIVYLFTSEIIGSLVIGALLFTVLYFYLFNKLNKVKKFRKSLNNFSHFANSLIMQITVTPNVSLSINAISDFLDEKEKEVLQNDELLVKDKLESIEKNYNFPLFQVFKEIIVLYDTQGGNIIDMSMQLLAQIDNYIKNVEVIALDNSKKISEVAILWAFSFVALFYIRNVLYDYYIVIINNQYFKFIILLFFGLFVFSIFILARKYIEIKVGE